MWLYLQMPVAIFAGMIVGVSDGHSHLRRCDGHGDHVPTRSEEAEGMRVHSETAWNIASNFSDVLASDTRTLAAMIDDALDARTESAAQMARGAGEYSLAHLIRSLQRVAPDTKKEPKR